LAALANFKGNRKMNWFFSQFFWIEASDQLAWDAACQHCRLRAVADALVYAQLWRLNMEGAGN
jgi:hypothetical protein